MSRPSLARALFLPLVLLATTAAAQNLTISDAMVFEGDVGTAQMIFTINYDDEPPGPGSFVFYETADGDATVGNSDYVPVVGGQVDLGFESQVMVVVPVNGDNVVEGDEVFFVNITGSSFGASLLDPQGEGLIQNDDSTTMSVDDVMVFEGDAGTVDAVFTVSITQPSAFTVTAELNTDDDTALVGDGDYQDTFQVVMIPPGQLSQAVPVPVNGDPKVEPDETFLVNLMQLSGALPGDLQGEGLIKNDDSTTVSIGDVAIAEGDAGTTDAVFTLNLTNPSAAAVDVSYETRDGTATVGDEDYDPVADNVIFAPGEQVQMVTVPVNGDLVVEPDEGFFVDVTGATGADLGDTEGAGTILNDDGTMFSVDDASVVEGDSGTTDAVFTVSLSAVSAFITEIKFTTLDGGAKEADGDYEPVAKILKFDPGQLTEKVRVRVNGDKKTEPDETFSVELTNPEGATIGDGVGEGVIENDDMSALSISDATVTEGDSGTVEAAFTVDLSPASALTVTVDFATANGSASVADGDYQASSGSLSFPAGTTQRTVSVLVNGDLAVEPDEVFSVGLSNPSGAELADADGTGSIVNDDTEVGKIRLVPPGSVVEAAGTAVVQAERVGDPTGAASVRIASRRGTATNRRDFRAASATLNWAAGELGAKSFEVEILDDNLQEGEETVWIRLSQPSGGTLGDPSAAELTILDDDQATQLEPVGDLEQTVDADEELELQVRATRTDGSPVAGAAVDWEIEGDAEFVESVTTLTDQDGIASQTVAFGAGSGSVAVTAELVGTDAIVEFEVEVGGDLDELFDPSSNPAEASVADVLNDSCQSAEGDFADACDYLLGLDDEDKEAAISAITPRQAATAGSFSVDSPQVQLENLWLRLAAIRGGATRQSVEQLALNLRGRGVPIGVLATAFSRQDMAEETVADWIGRALEQEEGGSGGAAEAEAPAAQLADDGESRLGFFLSGRLSVGEEPRTGREEGSEFETLGLTAGLDYRLSDHLVLGGALGYVDADTEVDRDGGALDASGYSLSFFGTYFKERFYFDGVVSYGRQQYEAVRNIDLPVPFQGSSRFAAVGRPDGSQLSLGAGAGYDAPVGNATVTGLVRLSYVDADIDGYTESGASPFNLVIRGQDVTSLLSEGGVQVSWASSHSWGVLQPQLRLSHMHEFEDDSRLIRGRFEEDLTGGEFAIPTDEPDRDFFNAGVGLTATFARGKMFYIFYETDLERDDLDLYTISAGLRFEL